MTHLWIHPQFDTFWCATNKALDMQLKVMPQRATALVFAWQRVDLAQQT
jgi:hypothetical protein